MAPAAAKDDRQFPFEVERITAQRPLDRSAMADQAACHADEQGRVIGLLERTLLGVIGIVEADTDDLRRRCDGRKEGDARRIHRRKPGGTHCLEVGQRNATAKQFAYVDSLGSLQRHEAIVGQCPDVSRVVEFERRQLHLSVLLLAFRVITLDVEPVSDEDR